jgi:hypothetical protein
MGNRRPAAGLQRGMRHAPDMPELRKDPTTAGVDGLGHLAPSFYLRVIIEAWRESIASSLRGDIGSLRDNQPGRGALGIIFGHQGTRDAVFASATPRQRRHDDAVRELVWPEPHRLEQIAPSLGKIKSIVGPRHTALILINVGMRRS